MKVPNGASVVTDAPFGTFVGYRIALPITFDSTSELRVRLAPLNRFKPSSKIFY